MNWGIAIKGGIGILAGSFALGGIMTILKSRKETDDLCKKADELISESSKLVKQAQEDQKELDHTIADMESEIERIQGEVAEVNEKAQKSGIGQLMDLN